jgi:ABC-type sulfate transport system substrate-binding protein
VDNGLGPVTPQSKAYGEEELPNGHLFRLGDFGGWAGVDRNFFRKGGAWEQGFARTRSKRAQSPQVQGFCYYRFPDRTTVVS